MAASTRRLRSSKKVEVPDEPEKPVDVPKTPQKEAPQETEAPPVVQEKGSSSPKFVLDDSDGESEAVTPKEPVNKEPEVEADTEPELTQEQKDRIEANRKRALELREAKQKAAKM